MNLRRGVAERRSHSLSEKWDVFSADGLDRLGGPTCRADRCISRSCAWRVATLVASTAPPDSIVRQVLGRSTAWRFANEAALLSRVKRIELRATRHGTRSRTIEKIRTTKAFVIAHSYGRSPVVTVVSIVSLVSVVLILPIVRPSDWPQFPTSRRRACVANESVVPPQAGSKPPTLGDLRDHQEESCDRPG